MVGFTVEHSTIGTVRFEIAAASDLAEGDVIFTKVAGHEVFYQILDAETAEESFDQNPRGTHIVNGSTRLLRSEQGIHETPLASSNEQSYVLGQEPPIPKDGSVGR